MDLSIIIAVFNEEKNIDIVYNRLKEVLIKTNKEYEIILVNDGSTDGTFEVLNKLYSNNTDLRIIHFTDNCGLTAAFDAGFKAAQGKILITMDADLQYDAKDIPLLLEKLDTNDLVCGWRYTRKDPMIKKISSRIANFIGNIVLGTKTHDSACSLKAFKKECLEKLRLYRGMHRFLPALFEIEGYKVTEIKIDHFLRKYGKSKYNTRNRLLKSFIDLLVVKWMKKNRLDYKIYY